MPVRASCVAQCRASLQTPLAYHSGIDIDQTIRRMTENIEEITKCAMLMIGGLLSHRLERVRNDFATYWNWSWMSGLWLLLCYLASSISELVIRWEVDQKRSRQVEVRWLWEMQLSVWKRIDGRANGFRRKWGDSTNWVWVSENLATWRGWRCERRRLIRLKTWWVWD